jgi:hypothetical protein
MSDSISEKFKTEMDDKKDVIAEEIVTIIPSVSDIAMKEYQMKLSFPKKNKEEYLIRVIRQMMMNNWGMGINVYDPVSTYENLDINLEIETFNDIPTTAEGREHYFRPIHNKQNKTSTLIMFGIMTKYTLSGQRSPRSQRSQTLCWYPQIGVN